MVAGQESVLVAAVPWLARRMVNLGGESSRHGKDGSSPLLERKAGRETPPSGCDGIVRDGLGLSRLIQESVRQRWSSPVACASPMAVGWVASVHEA